MLPVFENASSADTDEAIDALEAEFAPRLAAHRDAIRLDPRLFARIGVLHGMRDELGLEPDQSYLLERTHREAVLAGAALDPAERERLGALNERISTLTTAFQQHLLADTNELALHLTDEAELDGLDAGARSAAREAAARAGSTGGSSPSCSPPGSPRSPRSPARPCATACSPHHGHADAAAARTTPGRRCSNSCTCAPSAPGCSGSRTTRPRSPPARRRAPPRRSPRSSPSSPRPRCATSRANAPSSPRGPTPPARASRAADWAFLAEQVRAERHDLDLAALRPYLELDRVLVDGVFHAATLLVRTALHRARRPRRLPPRHARFEVFEEDGTPVGLYLLDPYTRDSKRGGAWMSSLVSQSELTGDLPVVVNNLNVPKPAPGEPTLLTLDEAETLFHEFGHALHGLLARVRYPSQAGTSVYRDFVELPSQVNELWLLRPEILASYAVHHETGERMPQELVDRLIAARGFNAGFDTVEYLAAAALDQAWHRIGSDEQVTDVAAFEHEALVAAGLHDPLVPPRYSSTYFAHVFAGGYDAGYYSYIWSEVPGADVMAWFEERGGATRENGDRYRREILAPGGSRDPGESIRALLGREPSIGPLLARRGLS